MSFEGATRKGILKTRKLDAFISSVMILILICCLIICLVNKSFMESQWAILIEGWNFCINSQLIAQTYILVRQIRKRRKIVNLLEKIQFADKEVNARVFMIARSINVPKFFFSGGKAKHLLKLSIAKTFCSIVSCYNHFNNLSVNQHNFFN